jgi:hypothetical protein
MKIVLKNLAAAVLALTALTWPSLKVNATEVEDEHEATEDIGAREAYRRLQLQDENGYVAPDAWTNAYAEKNQMRFLPEAWSEFTSAAELEAGVVGGRWTSIGPGNIGGRIRSMVIKPPTTPNAPRTIFAGAVSGGVWKSINSGTTWTTNTDFLANLAVNCMAIDPANPNILYAGTGEGFAVSTLLKATAYSRQPTAAPRGINCLSRQTSRTLPTSTVWPYRRTTPSSYWPPCGLSHRPPQIRMEKSSGAQTAATAGRRL